MLEKQSLSNSLGLSARTANTEETVGSSAERRQDDLLTADKSKKIEAAAAELEASGLFDYNPSNSSAQEPLSTQEEDAKPKIEEPLRKEPEKEEKPVEKGGNEK